MILREICGLKINPPKTEFKTKQLLSGLLTHFEKSDIEAHTINTERVGKIQENTIKHWEIMSDFSFKEIYQELVSLKPARNLSYLAMGTTQALRLVTTHKDCIVKNRFGNIFLTFKDELLPIGIKYEEENLVFGSLIKRQPENNGPA